MRKALIVILVMCCFLANAQDKRSLEKRAQEVYTYTAKEDFEKVLDLTYPKLFEFFPREKMMDELNVSLESEGHGIAILDTAPNFKFDPIQKVKDNYYTFVHHDLQMKVEFKEPLEEDEKDIIVDLFKLSLETEDVKLKDNTLIIKIRSKMIAISEKAYGYKWYFINYNSSQAFTDKLFSPEVQKALKINTSE